ncbi:MAG: PstA family ABC transporter permease, partial [Fervidobacterium sp.]
MNLTQSMMSKKNKRIQNLLKTISYIISGMIIVLFVLAAAPGLKYWNLEFFTDFPMEGMTKGGIFPAILGSFLLTFTALAISIPLGVLLGIVLSEYNFPYIKFAVTVLSGIPSVVYGLFGLGLFCITMGMRTSILAGSLTLSLMVLPFISSSVYEVMKSIPNELREAAYGLGARKSEVIFDMLLPSVKKSIITVSLVSAG